MTTVQQDFQAIVGNWETPADWITGAVPTSSQDAAIGAFGESSALIANSVTPNNVITVNSIAVNRGSALTIGDDDTLIATNGTVTSQSDTDVFVSGNLGVINVEAGGVLEFGAFFYNAGTLNVQESAGLVVNDAADLDNTGTINLLNGLTIDDSLTVWGKGLINLGANLDNAAIVGPGDSAFTNVDDTISGQAIFLIRSFDNEAGGTIVAGAAYASGQPDDYLTIDAATISNAGAIDVVANSELFLNSTWGVSGSLINTGQINVASQSVLAIGADFTVSGAGVIALDGAGAFIDSDLLTASWTLTNDSTIEGLSSQTELGQNGANEGFLTLVNEGSIIADLSGNELTVSTGSIVIQDAGGLFEAENGALLVIDSAVRTGQDVLPGSAPPPQSTIEAASGGVVDIDASILDGVSLGFGNQLNGQILIEGGTVNVAAGVSLGVPVTFVGAGGKLDLTNTPVDVDVNGAGGAINCPTPTPTSPAAASRSPRPEPTRWRSAATASAARWTSSRLAPDDNDACVLACDDRRQP